MVDPDLVCVMCLPPQALQIRAEDSSQEVQNLHRKVQDYMSDISRIENLLSVKVQSYHDLGSFIDLRLDLSVERSLSLEESVRKTILSECQIHFPLANFFLSLT